jgi:hypothetical protein
MTDNDNAGDGAVVSVKEALVGSGIGVLVGWYRDGWAKDPGELSPTQRVTMYNSAVPYHRAWS